MQSSFTNYVTITSMTALASLYTEEGFAIGADSLRMDMYGQIVTEQAVKIFETGDPDFAGAYGFAGMTAFEFADGRPMLDVLETAKAVAAGLLTERFDSAEDYADRFCGRLAGEIQNGTEGKGIAIPETFRLHGMFSGYSGGQAFFIKMQFPFVSGYLLRPVQQAAFTNPINEFCIVSGSEVVANEMSDEACETLKEAIDFVQDYIKRCIENDTDPRCANIGGKAQVATVAPGKGFGWAVAPWGPQ